MKLIVGLGNPGSEYERTRHNVGFRVADELARRWQIGLTRRAFSGLTGSGRVGDESVLLLKPWTYMNRSGRAVREAVSFHKLSVSEVLVIVDDMALPLGRIRVRGQGSAGGHNGLSDIIEQLQSQEFARIRVGIEQARGSKMVSHVLSPFSSNEEPVIRGAIEQAASAAECWVAEGLNRAMNQYNVKDD